MEAVGPVHVGEDEGPEEGGHGEHGARDGEVELVGVGVDEEAAHDGAATPPEARDAVDGVPPAAVPPLAEVHQDALLQGPAAVLRAAQEVEGHAHPPVARPVAPTAAVPAVRQEAERDHRGGAREAEGHSNARAAEALRPQARSPGARGHDQRRRDHDPVHLRRGEP